MSAELFIRLVTCVVTIVIVLISTYVIPWLKAKCGNENMNMIMGYIAMAVRCAEQIYTPDQWKEKKEFVMDYMLNIINTVVKVDLTREQLDVLIEGAVNEIKKNI